MAFSCGAKGQDNIMHTRRTMMALGAAGFAASCGTARGLGGGLMRDLLQLAQGAGREAYGAGSATISTPGWPKAR